MLGGGGAKRCETSMIHIVFPRPRINRELVTVRKETRVNGSTGCCGCTAFWDGIDREGRDEDELLPLDAAGVVKSTRRLMAGCRLTSSLPANDPFGNSESCSDPPDTRARVVSDDALSTSSFKL